jgi:uncharacterized protein (DUF362 family)
MSEAKKTHPVAVVDVDHDVRGAVEQAMSLAEWQRHVPAGVEVCLKPNLCFDYLVPGFQTTPWVLEAVIENIRGHVGRITVVEADTSTTSADRGARVTGISGTCRRHNVPFINLSRERFVPVEIKDGQILQGKVELPEILTRSHLITLPVLKTHCLTTVTGAIKNQFGCLPLNRYMYHPVLDQVLADLLSVLPPAFCVMDGTIGAEGDGPKQGRPRVTNLLLASADAVALDSVAARIMGFDPAQIGHIQRCAERGLGLADLQQIPFVGRDISELNLHFQPAHKNLVAILDLGLRLPVLGKVIFHTPLIHLFQWGARMEYLVWLALRGQHYKRQVRQSSWYAQQWWPHCAPLASADGTPSRRGRSGANLPPASASAHARPEGEQRYGA